jgi:hypothetical protein
MLSDYFEYKFISLHGTMMLKLQSAFWTSQKLRTFVCVVTMAMTNLVYVFNHFKVTVERLPFDNLRQFNKLEF